MSIYCFFVKGLYFVENTANVFVVVACESRDVCGKHVAWVMLDMPSYQLRQDVLRSILQIRQRAGPVKSGTFESADRSAGLSRQVRGKLVFDNAAWQPY